MAEKVSPHTHCQVCMKSIPVNEKFCSEECKQKFIGFQKKRKLLNYFMLGMIAAVIILVLFVNSP